MISAGGGVLGLISLGPIGGIAGTAVTKIVLTTYREYLQRSKSSKQQEQVDEVLMTMYSAMIKAINDGRELRQDGFIIGESVNNPAQELLGNVLEKSMERTSVLKNKHLALFFTNSLFLNGFSKENSAYLLKLFGKLTARQLYLIKLFSEYPIREKSRLKKSDYQLSKRNDNFDTIATCQEIIGLYDIGLLTGKKFKHNTLIHYWWNVIPYETILTQTGQEFFNLFSLEEIDDENILNLINSLSE